MDNRGFFFESFKNSDFKKNIYDASFLFKRISPIQKKEPLRGLHFQKISFEQSKLVSCIYGEILDVVVDLRKDSNTFKSHYSVKLNSINNHKLLFLKVLHMVLLYYLILQLFLIKLIINT